MKMDKVFKAMVVVVMVVGGGLSLLVLRLCLTVR